MTAMPYEGNDRDSNVVEEICGYITSSPPRSFFLFAGAGSGKTRTLVEVLRRITGVVPHEFGSRYAATLRARGQSVRVITFTRNATGVILGRLGENYLTSVSTIHAFAWELIRGFDEDIRDALLHLNELRLLTAQQEARKKVRGESEADRRKYAEIQAEAEKIRQLGKFIYHPDQNLHGEGALSHADVLEVAAWLLRERPTLQQILEDSHPLVLIDESQDTMKSILDALMHVSASRAGRPAIGLLGDHRQRIYPHGHEDLPSHIPPEWARPALRMNHRSQMRIVKLINDIWDADIQGRTQAKTGVAQHARTEKNAGAVRIFVGDSKNSPSAKLQAERACAEVMAATTQIPAWTNRDYKTLALEHRLAATRGGFLDVYSALDLLDKDAAAPSTNGDRTGPAMVRPLLGALLDLARCILPDGSINEFSATQLLRRAGALVALPAESSARNSRMNEIQQAVAEFASAIGRGNVTIREALKPVLEAKLLDADTRLAAAFGDESPPPDPPAARTSEPIEDRRRRGWHALFRSPWTQVALYKQYLEGEAQLATHQVVKGSEFKHVMVVMDDEDAGGFLFAYDKLFGGTPLSDRDRENVAAGKETTIDRTLRLLYVTCSRAQESLALVLWARDPQAALRAISESGWFEPGEIQHVPATGQ